MVSLGCSIGGAVIRNTCHLAEQLSGLEHTVYGNHNASSLFTEGLESYHTGIAAALADPTGKIYIDTSMLMWLLKIGKFVRAQFLAWSAEPWIVAKPFIPVWSVHELYRHLQDRVVIGQTKEFTAQYESSFRALVEHADMLGDDTLCANSPLRDEQICLTTFSASAPRSRNA